MRPQRPPSGSIRHGYVRSPQNNTTQPNPTHCHQPQARRRSGGQIWPLRSPKPPEMSNRATVVNKRFGTGKGRGSQSKPFRAPATPKFWHPWAMRGQGRQIGPLRSLKTTGMSTVGPGQAKCQQMVNFDTRNLAKFGTFCFGQSQRSESKPFRTTTTTKFWHHRARTRPGVQIGPFRCPKPPEMSTFGLGRANGVSNNVSF